MSPEPYREKEKHTTEPEPFGANNIQLGQVSQVDSQLDTIQLLDEEKKKAGSFYLIHNRNPSPYSFVPLLIVERSFLSHRSSH